MDIIKDFYIDELTGCHVFTGRLNSGGYGSLSLKRRLDDGHIWTRNAYAHILAYTNTFGCIPEGKCLHHTCGNKACINPAHLQLLTPAEHIWVRGNTTNASHVTQCIRGHAYDKANTRWIKNPNGRLYRQCRTCDRIRQYSRYHQHKSP